MIILIVRKVLMTEMQKGIFLDCQIGSPEAYHIAATIRIRNLDETLLEHALLLLIHEQAALRSCVEIVDDLPGLTVYREAGLPLVKYDLTSEPGKREEQARNIIEQAICRPFDLFRPPLFRAALIKIAEQTHLLTICIHHLVADGLSLNILVRKWFEYYDVLAGSRMIPLRQDNGFIDFIRHENDKLQAGKYREHRQYWIDKMHGAEPPALQLDYPLPQRIQGVGREIRLPVSSDLFERLQERAAEHETTGFMFVMAAFALLLHQYTRQEDIVYASPFTYRPDLQLEETIGCFVSMLPIRFNVQRGENFLSLLRQAASELIQIYQHIGYPNNLILRDSGLVPMPGSPSVLDVSLVYDAYEEEHGSLDTELVDLDVATFPGTLMVVLNKTSSGLVLRLQFKPDVWSDESILLFGRRFLKLLGLLADNPLLKLGDVDLLLEGEREQILDDFNRSSYFPYRPRHIIDIFHDRAARYPDRIALIEDGKTLTYSEVNARTNQLAWKIIQRKKNNAIGIQLERSSKLVIAILAVLKAGCFYVPIDPHFPEARKAHILRDADIQLILSERGLPIADEWETDTLYLDDADIFTGDSRDPGIAPDPYSLAYIMYTSGSTGKPKGVMVENHSVVNTLMDLDRRFPLRENDAFLLKTPFTFDVSATELFGWFIGEGALVIPPSGAEKDPRMILDYIERHKVTHVNFVPTMFRMFLELFDDPANVCRLRSLKWIFIGGEAVTPDMVRKFHALGTDIRLENVYGPTECTIWMSHSPLHEPDIGTVTIGKPLNETRWYVVGDDNRLQPIGVPGELCLSGVGLARGYLNMDELTRSKFVPNPFYREGIDPEWFRLMYRTGDLARWLPNGDIQFLGRLDFQVKLRGIRIETAEIEHALEARDDIIQAVCVVKELPNGSSGLCAYYLADKAILDSELKEYLAGLLPAHMIPAWFVHRTDFPVNSSGKVDRNALAADQDYMRDKQPDHDEPTTELQSLIASVWQEVLSVPRIGLDDTFFEAGGDSVSLIQVHNKLMKQLGREFPLTLLFQYPTVRQLTAHFSREWSAETGPVREEEPKVQWPVQRRDIAIIGMSVNVPGADNIRDFWHNLVNGVESIRFYTDEELLDLGIDPAVIKSPKYVKAKGRVEGIDEFDPAFFGLTPADAQLLSPQLRLLFKGTWAALEDAGYYPESTDARIGLFVGGSDDFEWYRHVLFNGDDYSRIYQAYTMSTNHFLATRIAHALDIRGPVLSALTACSTTLVTPHLACQSLLLGECDMAIAGGVTVELPNDGGYHYEEGMMFSPDGHCRPFDAEARGTMFSNGMGLIVLKRLDEAIADGDHIYAVIKGSAINNDGSRKVGFTAPSVEGQAEVIRRAYQVAGVDPETVSYVEAHGTGTALGDPIEVESLTQAFATDKKQFCYLGSVKGNVGHTDTAAGVVGLAKVALSLKHRFIPPTINFRKPNPKIHFPDTPFKVADRGIPWEPGEVTGNLLRAGINSFGVGGTNVHMVLEEAPKRETSVRDDSVNLLVFSAKSPAALEETSRKVMEYMLAHPELSVSDAAWTLQVGRKPFHLRKTVVINESFRQDPDYWLNQLAEAAVSDTGESTRRVVFMFPGQGSQYQGMGRALYVNAERSAISRRFKRHMDRVFDLLDTEERNAIKAIMYGEGDHQTLNQTAYSQFALFATGYALARTLMDIGVRPSAMIGHSIGELTAAVVAGVFDLEDAVRVVRMRGTLMQQQQPGVMLAVMASAREIEPLLETGIWLALENTSQNSVVGGSEEAVSAFERKLEQHGLRSVRIKTSHAFHTPMMEEAARHFREFLEGITMREPEIPIVSNVTGTWIAPGEMTRPEYWADHILRPVRFRDNLAEVLKQRDGVFVELGAGHTLTAFARQHEDRQDGQVFINLIRHVREQTDDVEFLVRKLGNLWSAGIDFDWQAWHGENKRCRVSLPTYAFERQPFPITLEPVDEHAYNGAAAAAPPVVAASAVSKSPSEIVGLVIEAYRSVFGFSDIEPDQDFFELGGDSLKAVSLAAAIRNLTGVKVEIADLFEYTTPAKLAARIGGQTAGSYDAAESGTIHPAPAQEVYPLSAAQRRMYTLYLLDQGNVAYNLPSITRIEGQLDKQRVEQTVRKLIQRHESLRTSFEIRDNRPVQRIHETVEAPLVFSRRTVRNNDDIERLMQEFVRPFELDKAPLFRIELVETGPDSHLLLLDFHHIIADGTSVEIITRDFNELYAGELEPLRIQYKDFAVWQDGYLRSPEIEAERAYWMEQLEGPLPVLELPTDFKRPAVKTFEGDRVYFTLDGSLMDGIEQLSRKTGATNNMILLSAWYVLLSRYSGQEDIIVGTPVAGRSREEIRDTVGMFVNMLAMRNRPESAKPFNVFLNEVKTNALKAFDHQHYPFDELVEQLRLDRDLNRNALFDVCFDYQNMEFHELAVEGIRVTPHPFWTRTSTYDLVLTCQENRRARKIEAFLEYSAGLFKKETIERMAGHFRMILSHIIADPSISIGRIGLLTPEETDRIRAFNQTALAYDETLTIRGMFEQTAERMPDKIALIVSDGRSFTYRELNERANELAWQLIEAGVDRNRPVGILTKRDEHLFISLLAVLKAGSFYVPIDPAFPGERIAHMLETSHVSALICPREYRNLTTYSGMVLECESAANAAPRRGNPSIGRNDLACVIFTSGSTGKPKGVKIRQSAIVNFIQDCMVRGLFETDEDRIISVTTQSFDIFAFESLVPLCTGHSVYLANEAEQLDPALAARKIVRHRVTHILSTVSRIKTFVENPAFEPALRQLTCILSGGEHYPVQLMADLQRRTRARLFNLYGPTETTIWSTAKELTHARDMSIGRPIANTQVYIVSPAGKLQPIGVYGELCIAGHGLAAGYLNNPEETARRFVPLADLADTIVYRTGDWARFLDNGEIELIGRMDTQVKIRGYRIELSEIEMAALGHEWVRDAAVTVENDPLGNKHLALFYALKPGVPTGSTGPEDHTWLRRWLEQQLPHYMLPTWLVKLERMPVLPNGKIDRNALKLREEQTVCEEQPVQPSTWLEDALLNIWREVLNNDQIGVRDNFFDVGGNSLALMIAGNKLTALLGRPVPLMQLFQNPTIESLAKSLGGQPDSREMPAAAVESPSAPESEPASAGAPESASAIGAVSEPMTPMSTGTGPFPQVSVPDAGTSSDRKQSHGQPLRPVPRDARPGAGDIAVIGMACKFPGADNPEMFWRNLVAGTESITRFSVEELREAGIPPEQLDNPNYVRAKGIISGIEHFDAPFFDYPYAESNMMDPQIRLLHQCVWEALENAGCDPSSYEGRIGLFAGSSSSMPWMLRFIGHRNDLLQAFEAMTLNEKDYLTTRISYKLNLRGPSVNVQTACSTSLVAIHEAVQSILRGESDMAVAGGVSISYPIKEGYLWHEGMIFSRDGHCKPFSDQASGTVSGNGCGVVVLKPLEDALRDGDHIYAVIKGSAINNDGTDKVGYTAPSISGQAGVIREALRTSGVNPEDIAYVEAHGTGTSLGDPIEIEALKQAWNTERKGYCAIGSVKANIGHLDAAAGVAGFIKAVLILYHRTVPPQIHFERPNPNIHFADSPFYVATQATPIGGDGRVLRAAVSSFGIGGTNAHIILEQPPEVVDLPSFEKILMLPFSARSETALANTSEAVLRYLADHPEVNRADAAWTLQTGRRHFEYRKMLVVDGSSGSPFPDVIASVPVTRVPDIRRPILFVFPGEEGWFPGMGSELYHPAATFRAAVICREHLERVISLLDDGERRHWLQMAYGRALPAGLAAGHAEIRRLAAFAIGYALAKTVIQLGVRPDGVIFDGVGEASALAALDLLPLEDALAAVRANCPPQPPASGKAVAVTMHRTRNSESVRQLIREQNALAIELGAGIFACASDEMVCLLRKAGDVSDNGSMFYEGLARLWCAGVPLNWAALHGDVSFRRRVPLPVYVFDRIWHEHDLMIADPVHGHPELRPPMRETAATAETAAESPAEVRLAELWNEVLGCGTVRPEDDFFTLGGHSLKAISLAARIKETFGIDLPLTELFERPTFGAMTEWLANRIGDSGKDDILKPATGRQFYAVSSAQKRMFAIHQMIGGSVPYNLASAYLLEGEVDKERFVTAIDRLVERHESFRTSFAMIGDEVVQFISDTVPTPVEFAEAPEDQLGEEIKAFVRPFDLAKAPLLRVKLVSFSARKHLLLIDMHHIIADQSSIAILLREFAELYRGASLLPASVTYKDFAAWQNERASSGYFDEQLAYWKAEFADGRPVLDLPIALPRPPVQTFDGSRIHLALDRDCSDAVRALARQFGATPYMVFMAALKLLLWKVSGQRDLVIGTAVAGRNRPELESIVGMFVNMLAIRSQVDEEMTIADYLHYMKSKLLKAYENQDCQYESLVEQLALDKDVTRNALFDVVFNYINMGTEELSMDGLRLTPVQPGDVACKFDLMWTILESEGRYDLELEFNTSLFHAESVRDLGMRWIHLLSDIAQMPERKLKTLHLLTSGERKWLLEDLNRTATPYPADRTIIQLFLEQARLHANRTAVIWEGGEWTYAQLAAAADRIFRMIVDCGVSAGQRIALLLDRGPQQIAAIFGVLKACCAYVPIDPDSPDDRVRFILEDSGAVLAITQANQSRRLPADVPAILFDEADAESAAAECASDSIYDPPAMGSSSDLAYIMYTSGSTGKPKGTLITHRSVIRVVRNMNYVTIGPEDRLLQLSNYAFDGSVFDIFGALLNGAGLVLVNRWTVLEIDELGKLIEEKGVTVFFVTTSLFNLLVDGALPRLRKVRRILFGGEAASVRHARKALNALGPGRLINVYGPTETTVFATYYPICEIPADAPSVPIGKAISNTTLYVLDQQGQPVPPGVPGELFIGGDGVGSGYLNRDDLTRDKFVVLPVAPGERLYRTGDLVRYLPTGDLDYIGRLDFQVKIRGFRIELGEIEARILQLPGVREAAVVARRDQSGSLYLAAFYSGETPDAPLPDDIRRMLADMLPEYMVPARIVKLDQLPLNRNGKIDRQSLPADTEAASPGEDGRLCPTTPPSGMDAEEIILSKMREVLDDPRFGRQDNFFRHGGHSIKAIALVQALAKEGIFLKVNEVFRYPTAAELAVLPSVAGSRQAPSNEPDAFGTVPQTVADLEDGQIEALIRQVQASCAAVGDLIRSAQVKSEFPLSPVQRAHRAAKSRISGFTAVIRGFLNQRQMQKLLADVILEHQLLHSVMEDNEPLETRWREMDLSGLEGWLAQQLPYADLSILEGNVRERVVKRMYEVLLLQPHEAEGLPWRLVCLRIVRDRHLVIWGFDHTAFDGMSAEIIRHRLESGAAIVAGAGESRHSNGREEPHPQKYSDYVDLLRQGPQDLTENELIRFFALRKWTKLSRELMDRLTESGGGAGRFGFIVPLAATGGTNALAASIRLAVRMLSEYTGMADIPLAIVSYGRSYRGRDFFNCVGEFLDLVPLVMKRGRSPGETLSLLEKCREHGINFMSLLLDSELARKYGRLASLLAPFYQVADEPKPLVLFNFQGAVSEEELKAFAAAEATDAPDNALARFAVTARVEGSNLAIIMESVDGIREERMREIADRLLSGDETVDE